ncbi:MAG TPA: lysophospholipid acyltransferase family protein [Lentisphaeria bacterium]|nr:lysophospholipid acyltransferase family protein [Lentisphaeria bacterium]
MAAGRRRKRKTGGKIRDAMMNALLPPLLWVVGCCSGRTLRRIAALGANLARVFYPGGLRLIAANLAIALPELTAPARRRLAVDNLMHTLWMGLDVISNLSHPERLRSRVVAPDPQLYTNDSVKPFILCLPHLGNWELFGQATPLFGIKSAAVAKTFSNRKLTELVFKARESNGLEIIPHQGAARGVLAALRNGRNIGLLIDQNVSPSRGGIYASFFGLPAPTSRLPAMLARRLGLPVLIGTCVRGDDGLLHFDSEPLAKAVADYPDDASLTQDILHATEALVKRHPEQYIWLYRRWRRIPGNTPAEVAGRFPYYAEARPEHCPEELFQAPTPHTLPTE